MNVRKWLSHSIVALFSAGLIAAAPVAKAELIGTQQLTAQPEPAQSKNTIDNFIARAEVQKKLQEMGLSAVITAQRVSLLSDAEANELAQKINAMPAGGNLSNMELIIILLVAILVVLIL